MGLNMLFIDLVTTEFWDGRVGNRDGGDGCRWGGCDDEVGGAHIAEGGNDRGSVIARFRVGGDEVPEEVAKGKTFSTNSTYLDVYSLLDDGSRHR